MPSLLSSPKRIKSQFVFSDAGMPVRTAVVAGFIRAHRQFQPGFGDERVVGRLLQVADKEHVLVRTERIGIGFARDMDQLASDGDGRHRHHPAYEENIRASPSRTLISGCQAGASASSLARSGQRRCGLSVR